MFNNYFSNYMSLYDLKITLSLIKRCLSLSIIDKKLNRLQSYKKNFIFVTILRLFWIKHTDNHYLRVKVTLIIIVIMAVKLVFHYNNM